jgi:hypothetical protein
MVVAPRPRVPVPVQVGRPTVTVPVARPAAPAPLAAMPVAGAQAGTQTAAATGNGSSVAPWVSQRTAAPDQEITSTTVSIDLRARHDSGLLRRGVHTEIEA